MATTLQKIFERGFNEHARSRPLPLHVHKAARAIRQCRTAALGGHVVGCKNGHLAGVWYNSCRHRSCPQCCFVRVEQWLDGQKARLLRSDHYHVIFTLPHELEPLWHTNRARMTDLLYRCAHDTLFDLLADPKYLGAAPGVLATLHTWGRTLSFHPHLHCLVTGGGWDGAQWKSVRSGYLLPFRVVRALFRGKLLQALRKELDEGRVTPPPELAGIRVDNLLRHLWEKKWNVRIQQRYPHGEGVVTYLARYLRGGPISNRRLLSADDNRVVFRYQDHRDGQSKALSLPTEHFIQRILWHIPEPRSHAVRHWGLYARSCEAKRERCRADLGQAPIDAPAVITPRAYCEDRGWIEPATCAICGEAIASLWEFARGREPPRSLFDAVA